MDVKMTSKDMIKVKTKVTTVHPRKNPKLPLLYFFYSLKLSDLSSVFFLPQIATARSD